MIATNDAVLTRALNGYVEHLGTTALGPVAIGTRRRRAGQFAQYLVGWLREHGFELRKTTGIDDLTVALLMPPHEVAELLDAIRARGLRWADGQLHDGQPEPADGYVVFDDQHDVWQRDDTAAGGTDRRWFVSGDTAPVQWAELSARGPLSPPGGIAPTSKKATS